MACKREDRFRRNTIAFWLSDEEKAQVEARIILSGLPKGMKMPLLATGTFQKQSKLLAQLTLNIKRISLFIYLADLL